VKTKFSRVIWENRDVVTYLERATPLKRIGLPEDVVGAALYLASSASNWVTGTVLVIDGGYTLSPSY
jgi:NAD(P)-dependent dehydrogenase (short-subunit alcohol dehydrogenase family)